MKLPVVLTIFFAGGMSYISFASASPRIEWTRILPSANRQVPSAFTITHDGGYIITGSESFLGKDIPKRYWLATTEGRVPEVFVTRTDSIGNVRWSRTYGDPANSSGQAIYNCADGGFAVISIWGEDGGPADTIENGYGRFDRFPAVLKINSKGDSLWLRKFDQPMFQYDLVADSTRNGDFLIAWASAARTSEGYTRALCLGCLDAEGYVLWQRRWPEFEELVPFAVAQTANGGFLITCGDYCETRGGRGHCLVNVRVSSLGDTLWTASGTGKPFYKYTRFLPLTNGECITGTDSSVIIINEHAEYTRLQNPALRYDRNFVQMHEVRESSRGGYVVAGYYMVGEALTYLYAARLREDGSLQWAYPNIQTDTQYESSMPRVRETSDGGFVFVGDTDSYPGGHHQILLVKFRSDQ